MLTSNENSCFSYNTTFCTKLLLQNKQNTCKIRPYYNTVNYAIVQRTKQKVERELGQTINNYAIKTIDKIKNLHRTLVSGKFPTNLCVKSTYFAEIMALNECFKSGK